MNPKHYLPEDSDLESRKQIMNIETIKVSMRFEVIKFYFVVSNLLYIKNSLVLLFIIGLQMPWA